MFRVSADNNPRMSKAYLERLYLAVSNVLHFLQCLLPECGYTLSPDNRCPLLHRFLLDRWCRPLRTLSQVFSECVPIKIWAGFTHLRLSQVWQANNPFLGYRPCFIFHDILWASTFFFSLLSKNRPYPPRKLPDHSQQSFLPSIFTFSQNLSMPGGVA